MNAVAHNHDACVSDALHAAEITCQTRGVRLTPSRKRVLELIWSGHHAVKAYDIIDSYGGDGPAAKPPTVYRALEFLIEQGLIHRIESLNAFVGCGHVGEHDECGIQLLICEGCALVQEIHTHDAAGAIRETAEAKGFSVTHQVIEVHGLCPDCQRERDAA